MAKKLKKNTFIEGTIIASLAIIISKILGALYVIPFYSIIGENGGVLYSYAYNIYNLFLNISTAGLPLAISMLVSEYNSLHFFEAKKRVYKVSTIFILIVSFITFLILMFFAPSFSSIMIKGVEGGNTVSDVATVIRAISFCLLVTPFISVIRGYLQGNKYIAPTSISQVIEQIVRIIVILAGSYISIDLLKTNITTGVCVALSGAFFGGFFAFLYLKYQVNKDKKLYIETKEKDRVANKEILKKLITFSIPLVLVSIVSNLYDIIDMTLIIRALYMIGFTGENAELIASITCTWAPKICMIITAVGLGLVTSLLPHMVTNSLDNNPEKLNHNFNQALATIITICLPMGIGLFFIADPAYYLFYGSSTYGGLILKFLAILTVIANIVLVVNMSLQSLKKFKIIYLNNLVGLIINLILDIPLVLLFNKLGIYPFYGTVTATIIGYICSLIICYFYIKKTFKFSFRLLKKVLKKLIIPILFLIVALIILTIIYPVNTESYLSSVIGIIIYVIVAVSIFTFTSYKTGLLTIVFGEGLIKNIAIKLHIKRKDDNNEN